MAARITIYAFWGVSVILDQMENQKLLLCSQLDAIIGHQIKKK